MMVVLYLTGISNSLSGKAVRELSMCYDSRKDLKSRGVAYEIDPDKNNHSDNSHNADSDRHAHVDGNDKEQEGVGY